MKPRGRIFGEFGKKEIINDMEPQTCDKATPTFVFVCFCELSGRDGNAKRARMHAHVQTLPPKINK